MSGVDVEFSEGLDGGSNQHVQTNQNGAYAVVLTLPVTNAVCVESLEMLDQDLTCGAVGSGGNPTVVSSSDVGRIVNFRICADDDYPACLRP